MSEEKEFGFIISQGISRNMTKAKLAEKFCNFLAEQKRELSKALSRFTGIVMHLAPPPPLGSSHASKAATNLS